MTRDGTIKIWKEAGWWNWEICFEVPLPSRLPITPDRTIFYERKRMGWSGKEPSEAEAYRAIISSMSEQMKLWAAMSERLWHDPRPE